MKSRARPPSRDTPPGEIRRLLTLCHGYPPYYGGAEHVAAHLAEAAGADMESHALTSDIGGRLDREEVLRGVRVHRVPARKREWTRHTSRELLSFHLSARRQLDRLMADIRPEYVIAHFAYPAGAVAAAIRARAGVPYAVVLHGSDVPGYQSKRFGFIYPAYRRFFRRICDRADRVVAVSHELASLAGASWPGRITVIHNGVDIRRFSPGPPRPAGGDRLRVALTAQLIERKGVDTLLDALQIMAPEDRGRLDIRIYGEGPHRPHLERRISGEDLESCVHLEGLCPADRMPEALRAADLFVLPSFQEGLPLSLLEAMAAGLPATASRVGGIPSVLHDGQNGLLVPPGDAIALCDALHRLRRDPELRRRLGAAARATAETMSWDEIWKQYRQQLFPAIALATGSGSRIAGPGAHPPSS